MGGTCRHAFGLPGTNGSYYFLRLRQPGVPSAQSMALCFGTT